MTNHHLSVEQRFHLEAAFREIDACQDLEKLREVTKQIITAQENEKAFACLLYTSPSPRDLSTSRMPSSA